MIPLNTWATEAINKLKKGKKSVSGNKLIGNIAELKPVKMAVVGMMPDGRAFTAQYGDCDPYELALMAFHIQTDAIMDIVKANAGEIVRAAEEQEDKNE